MEPDLILADIIAEEMSLDADRVVVYDQNFKPPKDEDIYVVIAFQSGHQIGSNKRFDPDTNEENQYVSVSETYNIEITSKNRDAQTRKYEVTMALDSTYSQQKQEEEQVSIFRSPRILDISFIEGAFSLHRFRIPVIINSTKTLEKSVEYFDKFQANEEAIEP